ncbi:MAG: hypothetical protein JWN04_3901 [Myxococcaceae bacterium]|nr:hypothetical protein [Myxococcaceae bacterium]
MARAQSLDARCAAIVPVVAQAVRESAGRIALRTGVLDAELRHELLDPRARLRPHLGIGAGLGWTHLRTRTVAPVMVERTRQFEACLLGLVGASLTIATRASLAFDLRAGAALPHRQAGLGGQRVGPSEVPLLIGSLTLQLSFG